MSSYMAYTVTTSTNLSYFKKKNPAVNRRFSDFLGLRDKLAEKYLQNGRIIPPAPDKYVCCFITPTAVLKKSILQVCDRDDEGENVEGR